MGKRSKSSFKKRGTIHKKRHKREKNKFSRKFRNARMDLTASTSTWCQSEQPAVPVIPAEIPEAKFHLNSDDITTMKPTYSTFKKFKDNKLKKPLKRINHKKTIPNKISYTEKLANSLKRRALLSINKNGIKATAPATAKRKLNFQSSKKVQRTQQSQQQELPKPKLYHNTQATGSNDVKVNMLEKVQVIEEIESSDDDDCIVLEPEVTEIKIEDDPVDSKEEKPTSTNSENISSCGFQVDKKRQPLLWTSLSSVPIGVNPVGISSPSKMDESCIIIDDSADCSPSLRRTDAKKVKPQTLMLKSPANNFLDDSVIFVQEDFIPLSVGSDSDRPKAPRKKQDSAMEKVISTPRINRQRMSEKLFTSTERKKLADYNSNTYNPCLETDEPITHKRPIIIDGSNVAFGHGRSNIFSAEGIKYCVEYFQKMGHDVKAVIPLFRRNPNKSSNPALLDQLHKDGKIVFTPCKNLPNQQTISYDDRFILQLAYERDAAVVSNDNYRDLIHENAAFKKIIENRVIGYSWCDNILILPKDPYGRFGPPLAEILRC